ncbi:Leukotriene A-4 hydrolase [Chamberlinius hualienensis]
MEGCSSLDPSSFSRSDQFVVTHLQLNLNVNFTKEILSGSVILSVNRKVDGVTDLILDSRNLSIFKASDEASGQSLSYEIITDDTQPSFLGQKLVVKLPDSTNKTYNIKIEYETSPKSTALQWLTPQQTAGKQFPYLFSQCQPIHARSMVPCQDTPSVKATYTATVTAPKTVNVLMSAVKNESIPSVDDINTTTHMFNQKIPIPSYLIAIVVGALENRKISDRINVWSEKEMVDKAAYEFAEAETMLTTAEKLVGPYIWGRYDILVLPPSFPYGGMENPCLTFVTPTVLAGDRSLADVIAHEISHSWTGNLVTNVDFEHFWLNEGFTVYLERLIDGEMFGEKQRQFKSIGGWKTLLDEIKIQGETGPFTKLVVDLKGNDPDDAFSSIPYEKGYSFLYYLEQLVGGRDIFIQFLRSYIEKYKHQSIDTCTWKKYFLEYFSDKGITVDFDTWLYKPGLPPVTPSYDQTMEQACIDLALRWTAAKEPSDFEQFSIEDIRQLVAPQIQEFLTLLVQQESLPILNLEFMEKIYKLNSVVNSEIRVQWLRLGLQSKWKVAIPLALNFVVEQGRMKFLKPLYRALYNWEDSRQLAIDTFLKHRDEMMYQSAQAIAKELHIDK